MRFKLIKSVVKVDLVKNMGVENVLSVLGRPFVQKVFYVLSAFKKLPVKDIEGKTGLSGRTVYDALTLLGRAGLVERIERGVYAVASSRNAKLFSEAYYQLLITDLAEKLTRIIRESEKVKASGKVDTRKNLLEELETLARDYGEVIEKEFPRSIQEIFLSLTGNRNEN